MCPVEANTGQQTPHPNLGLKPYNQMVQMQYVQIFGVSETYVEFKHAATSNHENVVNVKLEL